jgi:hypothetical protein
MWETCWMKRNLRMVTQESPFIGFCEACNAQFRSYNPERKDAEQVIKSEFAAHECKQEDFSHAG